MPQISSLKIVCVLWADHSTFSEVRWRSFEDVSNLHPCLVTTVGFLIKEAPDHIIVQSTMAVGDLQGAHETLILRGTIQSITRMGFGPKVMNKWRGK